MYYLNVVAITITSRSTSVRSTNYIEHCEVSISIYYRSIADDAVLSTNYQIVPTTVMLQVKQDGRW